MRAGHCRLVFVWQLTALLIAILWPRNNARHLLEASCGIAYAVCHRAQCRRPAMPNRRSGHVQASWRSPLQAHRPTLCTASSVARRQAEGPGSLLRRRHLRRTAARSLRTFGRRRCLGASTPRSRPRCWGRLQSGCAALRGRASWRPASRNACACSDAALAVRAWTHACMLACTRGTWVRAIWGGHKRLAPLYRRPHEAAQYSCALWVHAAHALTIRCSACRAAAAAARGHTHEKA